MQDLINLYSQYPMWFHYIAFWLGSSVGSLLFIYQIFGLDLDYEYTPIMYLGSFLFATLNCIFLAILLN